jgi:hypothetical protein
VTTTPATSGAGFSYGDVRQSTADATGRFGEQFRPTARSIGYSAGHDVWTRRLGDVAEESIGSRRRHDHRFLAHRVSWLSMSVYAPVCVGCVALLERNTPICESNRRGWSA